ncbi:Lipoyl synthase [Desulfotomaculum nigrificans CO-1-SRB]|uniref:Lipoyl synthase n=1 Tax=Desulfotomaculum nigrificans (strain DSM 14880 / VKM B-2319 / CO-1-SRB) TaxID=868595 RepID=F6B6W5_DESCC|nr:lipoyl synthase [Desulfotomaculum nigrificans]AEF93290.1 Lipoyl synthase [Desulfotomaculum nigrificans CO-1-SRB]
MHKRKPEWLRVRLQGAEKSQQVKDMLKRLSLHTVCEEANCPNLIECFGRKTATFMILGSVCTRNCTFCNVTKGLTQPVDPEEPAHVAEAVKELGLKHAVITSVTRDDLPDGGAGHFARVIEKLKEAGVIVEVLIPDFQGSREALEIVIKAKPHILNHNIETVPRLYPTVRPKASYPRSLELLKNSKELDDSIFTKSGIMVGLGEQEAEVIKVMQDLREVGCDILTIGQYLAPSAKHHPVIEYIHPDIFKKYKDLAYQMGFKYVAADPLVRSSYHAADVSEVIS